jgi:alcohol dehydrogenase class IV
MANVLILAAPPLGPTVEKLAGALTDRGASVDIQATLAEEPTIAMLGRALADCVAFQPDAVVGVGGGSVLDVAKLVAALHGGDQDVRSVFGIGQLCGRSTHLICLPTTAGTGSEVSPNAILLDEEEHLKKGVVSPHLVPDAAYVDPELTKTMPPHVTASTGVDALTHCIEAYANRFAHPLVDLYALKGISLIGEHLVTACKRGEDSGARTGMALGSLYGGLCLGPVNTGGVHALAYPLGGEFHVPHGVSNSLLLPHVLRFNIPSDPRRYANVALSLGAKRGESDLQTARRGLELIAEICHKCGIPSGLSEVGVPREAIPRMAESAMTVTRLLRNNPRELTRDDAEAIYQAAF